MCVCVVGYVIPSPVYCKKGCLSWEGAAEFSKNSSHTVSDLPRLILPNIVGPNRSTQVKKRPRPFLESITVYWFTSFMLKWRGSGWGGGLKGRSHHPNDVSCNVSNSMRQ